MDMKQLEYFIAIAKHRNFTAAAQEFYISQPSISHQIKGLEAELGVELLGRSTRRVELTVAGEMFLEDAKRAVDLLENAKRKLQQNKDSLLRLHIGYLASPTKNFLPNVLNVFHEQHPDVKVQLHRRDASQLFHDAKKGVHDIYCSLTEDMKQIPGLSLKSVQADYYCLVTQKNHPALQRIAIDYSKLASEPFVCMNPARAVTMHNQILEICRQLGFSPRIVETYDAYEDVLFAVESNIGISILPYRTREYMNNNLAYTLLDASQLSINVSLAWEKDANNPAVDLFLETFHRYMREHPDVFL